MIGSAIALAAIGAAGKDMVGLYGAYKEKKNAETQAQIQEDAARAEQANMYAQAAQDEAQARIKEIQAGNEQIKGEQEANKRSRALAQEIGSTYANWAGNGLMVDGGGRPSDTLGSILRTQTTEAQHDIGTINDKTAMNVWTYQANAAVDRASAANRRAAGDTAYRLGHKTAKLTAKQGALGFRMKAFSMPFNAMSVAGSSMMSGAGAGAGK